MWFFRRKKDSLQERLIKAAKEEPCDMQGLFFNINKRYEAQTLYKELCLLCHPDKFEQEPDLQAIALGLFEQVQNARGDYNKLLELKKTINEKLTKRDTL